MEVCLQSACLSGVLGFGTGRIDAAFHCLGTTNKFLLVNHRVRSFHDTQQGSLCRVAIAISQLKITKIVRLHEFICGSSHASSSRSIIWR